MQVKYRQVINPWESVSSIYESMGSCDSVKESKHFGELPSVEEREVLIIFLYFMSQSYSVHSNLHLMLFDITFAK